ncbi:hypothetical protein F5884DRAFT_474588 [Xylogone sp. PMI_703]|nr:hypothetical protein F5884DRAFT_474588 [Xylogone sp. PMI_703]
MGQEDNLQPWTIATISSVTVLAFVSVALRILSRYERKQALWWDDWMILFSMGWYFVVLGFIIGMLKCGMGIHANKVPMNDIVMMAKFLLVAEILYAVNLVWTKLSLLLMYYRIFHFRHFRRLAYIIGGFIIAWVICVIFLFIFICVPVQKLWYPQLPGHCINQVGTWIANAASTILTDLAILVLPIPHLWKLQLRRSEKIALTCAFSLGFFVVFASAYRFTVLFSYSNTDPTYTLARTVGWTAIEMSAGITSACLPTLRPAVQLILRTLGIKHSISLFRTSADRSKNAGTEQNGTNSGSQHLRSLNQVGNGPFVRLDEDHNGTTGSDSKFRGEHGYIYTVTSEHKGEGDSLSGDEVPLRSITVKKDFSSVTSP